MVDDRAREQDDVGTAAAAPSDDRRDAIQKLWTDGDYARVGELFEPASARVVDSLDLAGRRVLDAATGTGNTAILAAQAGAEVTAFDLTPALLDVARARADGAGVGVRFLEGDLTDIPLPDRDFEVVLSTFGAFVVDDQRACAEELVRVCAPDGAIVTTAWTDQGVFGSMLDTFRDRYPSLLENAPDQRAWSDPDRLATLFDGLGVDIATTTDTVWFRFPSVADAITMFEATSGPVQRMQAGVASLGGDWGEVRSTMTERWTALARDTDAGVELPSSYSIATIHRT